MSGRDTQSLILNSLEKGKDKKPLYTKLVCVKFLKKLVFANLPKHYSNNSNYRKSTNLNQTLGSLIKYSRAYQIVKLILLSRIQSVRLMKP